MLVTPALNAATRVKERLSKRSKRRVTPDAQARRDRIAAWRAAVDRDDFEHQTFAHSNAYATLRGHLPEDLWQEIDRWRDPYVFIAQPRRGRDPRQARLLQEIDRVEREWGLI